MGHDKTKQQNFYSLHSELTRLLLETSFDVNQDHPDIREHNMTFPRYSSNFGLWIMFS